MTPGEYVRQCRRAAKLSRSEVAIAARLHIETLNAYEADRMDIPSEWRLTLCAAVKADPAVLARLCAEQSASRLIDETRTG